MVNNIPVNGWPQLKDLEAVQPTLDRLDKIEAWKRTVKEETFTGDDITIENALALPARSLITEINAIQDLHGYDKPWVGGAGKNKFGGVFNSIFPVFVASGTTVTVSCKSDGTTMVEYTDQNNNRIDYWSISNAVSGESGRYYKTFEVTADAYGFRFYGSNSCTDMQVEIGSSVTSFAPYSNECPISGRTAAVITRSDGDEISEDFTIQLGQTVYGGSVDFTTGVARIDRAIVDMGDLGWTYSSANVRFQTNMPSGYKTPASASERIDGLLCSCYEPNISPITGTHIDGTISGYEGSITIYVNDSTYTDAALFKTARTGQKILYKLATPIELTLTPTQLQMLKGYNRVTIESGSIELGYIAKLT